MRVVRMRMSRSVLTLSAGKISTINSRSNNNEDVGIGWDDTPDNTGTAY